MLHGILVHCPAPEGHVPDCEGDMILSLDEGLLLTSGHQKEVLGVRVPATEDPPFRQQVAKLMVCCMLIPVT